MTDRELREKALGAVAVATRERIDGAVLTVFLDDPKIAGLGTEDFLAGCAEAEFLNWFPKKRELWDLCLVAKRKRIEALPKVAMVVEDPISPGKVKALMARVRAGALAKKMG